MSDTMLPPLVLELRARGAEFMSEMQAARAEVAKTAAETEASATKIEGSAAKAESATVASTEKASGGWSRLQSAGKVAAIGLAGAAIAVGTESIKMAGDFQAQVERLHTAAGESSANLHQVSDGILAVARATGTSTDELTSGAYQVESAGFHGADALKVLSAAAEGAKNEGADMKGVGNALTTVMTDLGAKSGQAATLMSQMVAAVGQGKMTMDDLAGSIHSVLPNAAALGISFPQVAGALATMTAEGVSADQAAQNLNHTIVKLAAPTVAMSNAMAAYGVNSEDLKNNLGKNGLTGTMDILSKAILDHMGPSGLALMDTFNKSKTAAADAKKMLDNLPDSLKGSAQAFLKGTLPLKEWQKAYKDMGAAGSAQGAQFTKIAQQANGFSDALKSGKSDAQTFTQAMYSMLGDQTGLQVALHLSGEHAATFANNVKVIGSASADANGHVKDWAETQDTFNNRMARLKETVQTAAIAIGQHLLPPVSAFVGFLAGHPGALIAFASVITGVLVVAAAAWAAQMAKTAASNVIDLAKMIAAGAKWVISTTAQIATTTAQWIAGAARWVAAQAVGWANMINDAAEKGAAWVATHTINLAKATAAWVAGAARWVAAQAVGMAKATAGMTVSMARWVATQTAAFAKSAAGLAAAMAKWVATQGAAMARSVAEMSASMASWVAAQAKGFAESLAAGAAWIAEHIAMAATAVAQYGIMAAAATAAFVAENAATLGIGALIAALVAGVIWLATHWSQAWDAIKTAAKWAYDNVIKPVGEWIYSNVLKPIGDKISWLSRVWAAEWNMIKTAAQWAYDNVLKPVGGWIMEHVLSPIGSAASSLGRVWSSIWNGIKSAISDAWSFIKPIADAIGKAIGSVGSGISAVKGFAGKVGNLLGFDNGGWIPGPAGAAQLVVAHGGEYVLSRDMLAGRQAVDEGLLGSAKSANGYTPAAGGTATAPSISQLALSGASPTAPSSAGGGTTVNVYAQTNADPHRIAAEAGWVLRAQAS